MEKTRIAAADVMGAAFSALWREKWLALLLASLVSVLTLIWIWPIIGAYADLLAASFSGQMNDPRLVAGQFSQDFISFLPYFLILAIPILFVQLSTYTLWSRGTLLGTQGAMEGGFRALANRTLWVFWRFVCGVGWMLVLIGGLMAVVFTFAALAGAPFGSDPGAGAGFAVLGILLVFPLYIAVIFGMMMLMVLIGISIHAEARDIRLPIHKAYGLMKGNLLRAGGFYLLVSILFQMGASPMLFMALPTSSANFTIFSIAGLIVALTISSLFYLLWLSYGAEYAKRLLPQLRVANVFE